MKKLIILLIIGLYVFSSCGKYEEGPIISFRTKKARLSGTWTIDETIGIDSVFNKNGFGVFEVQKDGKYIFFDNIPFDSSELTLTYKGTWEWNDTKEGIILYLPRQTDTLVNYGLRITKLGKEVLWFENDHLITYKCTKQ